VFLPLLLRQQPPTPTPTPTAPPFPAIPVMSLITPPEDNPNYAVNWTAAARAERYVLERATGPGFGDAIEVYAGPDTSYQAPSAGIATYYYRGKARNVAGDSGWSNAQTVEVRWESEPNGEPVDARGPLQPGLRYYGVLASGADEKDYFYLDLLSPRAVELWLTNMAPGQDFNLVLRDGSTKMVGYSGFLGNTDEHIATGLLPAGRYYVQVQRVTGDLARPYHLRGTW